MKLAHLILAHNNPVQLERLVKRLNHPDADVYIFLDKKAPIEEFASIAKLPDTIFIKERINVFWGEYTIMEATIIGLKEILASGTEYTHINLLSGNDYPLKRPETIQQFFFANPGKTFMWYDLIFNDWVHGQVRMNTYYLGYYGFPGRYQLASLINKIMPNRKLPGGLKAYGRSQWLTLTPECARYVIDFIRKNPAVERYFKMTWAVDEVFFQTILCNSPLKDTIVNDNLRYIALQPDFRPVVYTMSDAPTLASCGKFFARKFDLNKDAAIFDYLDKLAMEKG